MMVVDPRAIEKEVETSQKELSRIGREREKAQKEASVLLRRYYEKIAFYSVGAVSLSVTLLGFILKEFKQILWFSLINEIPIVAFLCLSWIYFVLALITGIVYIRFRAFYASYWGGRIYSEARKEFEQKRLELIKYYPGEILFSNGGTAEGAVKTGIANIKKLNWALKYNTTREKIYYFLMLVVGSIAELSFVLGITALVVFVIAITIKAIIFS